MTSRDTWCPSVIKMKTQYLHKNRRLTGLQFGENRMLFLPHTRAAKLLHSRGPLRSCPHSKPRSPRCFWNVLSFIRDPFLVTWKYLFKRIKQQKQHLKRGSVWCQFGVIRPLRRESYFVWNKIHCCPAKPEMSARIGHFLAGAFTWSVALPFAPPTRTHARTHERTKHKYLKIHIYDFFAVACLQKNGLMDCQQYRRRKIPMAVSTCSIKTQYKQKLLKWLPNFYLILRPCLVEVATCSNHILIPLILSCEYMSFLSDD